MAATDTLVRDARPADAPGIAAIGTVAVPETYRDLIGDPQVMSAIVEQSYAVEALRDCIARVHAARTRTSSSPSRRGRIVGFLHYDCQGPDPELHRIYADPERKRRGIGSALLEELHRRLEPGASYVLIVVAANRPALAFYAHHGLVERGRLDGVAYMHERMGVVFAPGTPEVPALILRFTKTN